MTLHFDAQLAERNFDLSFSVESGERIAVLGPNGSGKSTLLAILAGTVRPDSGRAELDGTVLFDLPAHGASPSPKRRRIWTKPHTRGISLLSQDPLLFPHIDVAANVAFGPRSKGTPRAEAAAQAQHWLDEVGVGELGARKPARLSGGQAQRVAVARALATDPRLLLLDEPMAALDVAVAPQLRRLFRTVLQDQSTLIVTHDLLDAALLSDRTIVLERGKIVEEGPTDQVLQHPKTKFTAGLAGLNLVRGTYQDGAVVSDAGFRIEGTIRGEGEGEGEGAGDGEGGAAQLLGQAAAAMFAPSAVSVYEHVTPGSPRNNTWVTVDDLEPKGDLISVRAVTDEGQVLVADVTLASVAAMDLFPGKRVVFSVKAASVTIYPA